VENSIIKLFKHFKKGYIFAIGIGSPFLYDWKVYKIIYIILLILSISANCDRLCQ